jgi:hypothetical protein
MGRTFCEVADCIREAREDGLCWGHAKRRRKGQAMVTLQANGGPHRSQHYPSPFSRFVEACISLADADPTDDSAWHRARMRVRSAAVRWLSKSKPRPR